MAWLLDTNILSELRRLQPEPRVEVFLASKPLDALHISVVTLAELRFGIELAPDATRRAAINDWLTNRIRPMFDGRVLPITEDIMLKWRLLVEEGRKLGHTFPQPDLIIAATAIEHNLTLVTRDRRGFDKVRVPIVNPWETS
jgi:predicted nucleic acid-binding protein